MAKKEDEVKDVNPEVDNATEETTTENAAEATVEISAEEKLEKELAASKDQYLRLFAEFENYKRRTSKERIELFTTANQELMSAMLPVMDDFDRAIKNIDATEENKAALDGITLIKNKLEGVLKSKGLSPMDSTIGQEFDVDHMEAITKIPAPTPDMAGKVIDEVEKGFRLGEKILRYPKVVVGEKAQ
ncbi:MAG: nucleotide exchange factor GrpE [Schleiferiaceae bacterium]